MKSHATRHMMMYRFVTVHVHFVADRRTDGQTDDIITQVSGGICHKSWGIQARDLHGCGNGYNPAGFRRNPAGVETEIKTKRAV